MGAGAPAAGGLTQRRAGALAYRQRAARRPAARPPAAGRGRAPVGRHLHGRRAAGALLQTKWQPVSLVSLLRGLYAMHCTGTNSC